MVASVLTGVSFFTRQVTVAYVSFAMILLTSMLIFAAFFWGFSLVLIGRIPPRRLKYLAPHAAVGLLSPLLYTINVSFALDILDGKPASGALVISTTTSVLLLLVQFSMGKAVVHRAAIHLVRR